MSVFALGLSEPAFQYFFSPRHLITINSLSLKLPQNQWRGTFVTENGFSAQNEPLTTDQT